MSKDEPAFPRTYVADGHNGMSLRDWFAGQALSGLLQNMHVQGNFDHSVRRNAESAYMLADEMMKARTPDSEPAVAIRDQGSPD